MRNIIFEGFGMENFGIYTDPMIIEIKDNKLIMIVGKNGVGKTTILNCLPFTCFGKIDGTKGESAVNNKVGKNCYTWTTFKVNDDSYKIDRYVKYHKIGTTVILSRNGEQIAKGQNEVKPIIEKLLVSEKLFSNTLFFGQQVKNFFTDLTDSEQKEIFRKILRLDNYTEYTKQVREEINDIKEKILKNEKDIQSDKQLFNFIRDQIIEISNQSNKFEKEKKFDIEKINNDIEKTKSEIVEEKQELEKLLEDNLDNNLLLIEEKIANKKASANSIIDEYNSKIERVESKGKIKKLEVEKESVEKDKFLKERFDEWEQEITEETHKNINEVQDLINEQDDKIQELKVKREGINTNIKINVKNIILYEDAINMDGECPTCNQAITEEAKKNLENTISTIKKNSLELADDLKQILKKMQEYIDSISIKQGLKSEAVKEMRLALEEIKEKQLIILKKNSNKLLETYKKIDDIINLKIQETKDEFNPKLIININDLLKIKEEIINKKKIVYDIKTIIIQKESRLDNLIKNLKEKENSVFNEGNLSDLKKQTIIIRDKIKDDQKEYSKLSNELKILGFWKDAFSSGGIPSMLIDEAIPFMNKRVSYYLDKLSGGRYMVAFDTLKTTKAGEFRDKINVEVFDNQTHANLRSQLSGGQVRIVDIAIILTLCDLQSSIQEVQFNILLFDEIFDSLDDDNIGLVADLLKELVKDKSIFIISHRHIDQIEYDELIHCY